MHLEQQVALLRESRRKADQSSMTLQADLRHSMTELQEMHQEFEVTECTANACHDVFFFLSLFFLPGHLSTCVTVPPSFYLPGYLYVLSHTTTFVILMYPLFIQAIKTKCELTACQWSTCVLMRLGENKNTNMDMIKLLAPSGTESFAWWRIGVPQCPWELCCQEPKLLVQSWKTKWSQVRSQKDK